ncbi:MAG: GTP 3',8-cyclase MoaA [Bacteroidetes bacterium]|nr:GTP 3',8-cyclase MoaA [Bacteroidota bacterium]
MLIDNFSRVHNYLRISITDKCNLRCSYCISEDLPHGYYANQVRMEVDEIDKIASIFVKLGITKIRITGGEPLVRKDAEKIIRSLAKYPVELVITTNGVYVDEFISVFKESNIKSVNVSLDSLNTERFLQITRRNEFQKVKKNIDLLLENDFHVKVNTVLQKGINDDEILDFIDWTKDVPVHVRFIEFMPFSGNDWDKNKVISLSKVLEEINKKYHFIELINEKNDTAKKYFVPNHKGTFAIISTMTQPFCNTCNRLRITSDGKMYNCLFGTLETDLLTALRNNQDIEKLIIENVKSKHFMLGGNNENSNWGIKNTDTRKKSMINIGG